MKGFAYGDRIVAPSLDITAPDTFVQIEYDQARGVMYVHLEGFTCLRICGMKDPVEFVVTGATLAETVRLEKSAASLSVRAG